MPAPGDQYRDTHATTNPFAEKAAHITQFTAKEIATLQSRLDRQLGPEFISTRPGNGGGKVHYLAAEKVINLANEVFGFNGWSSAIQNVQIDFVDENTTTGKINLGLSTIVRVTLRDGTYHEDIGYGHCENTKGKAAAFEKAKKEAATDAMKRALRNFGNVLGNCLYDKDYLQKIAKVKVAPSKWDAENLHRHPDYAPIKHEAISNEIRRQPAREGTVQRNVSAQTVQSSHSMGSEFEDEFGGNIFDETDYSHPDEVRVDDTGNTDQSEFPHGMNQPALRQGISRVQSMPQIRPPNPPRPPSNLNQPTARTAQPHTPSHQRPQLAPVHSTNNDGFRSNPSSGNAIDSPSKQGAPGQANVPNGQPQLPRNDRVDQAPQPVPRGNPEGFVAARQADLLNQPQAERPSTTALAFNPHAESPSIRRTQGINPGKSVPISRHQVQQSNSQAAVSHQVSHVAQPAGNTTPGAQRVGPGSTNYINPAADASRRVGMPMAPPAGGVQNRGGYRPPSAIKRPAMADVTNLQNQLDGAADTKKVKITDTDVAAGGEENTPVGTT